MLHLPSIPPWVWTGLVYTDMSNFPLGLRVRPRLLVRKPVRCTVGGRRGPSNAKGNHHAKFATPILNHGEKNRLTCKVWTYIFNKSNILSLLCDPSQTTCYLSVNPAKALTMSEVDATWDTYSQGVIPWDKINTALGSSERALGIYTTKSCESFLSSICALGTSIKKSTYSPDSRSLAEISDSPETSRREIRIIRRS